MLARLIMLVLSVYFALAGCQQNGEDRENFKFTEKELQREFIRMLEKDDISFTVDEDGYVWYSTTDKDRVKKITSGLIASEHSGNSITVVKKKYVDMLTSEMRKHKIPYSIKIRNGFFRVVWPKEYNKDMMEILKELRNTEK